MSGWTVLPKKDDLRSQVCRGKWSQGLCTDKEPYYPTASPGFGGQETNGNAFLGSAIHSDEALEGLYWEFWNHSGWRSLGQKPQKHTLPASPAIHN